MRKIIKLTESDLTRIVRRVLKEAKDDETQYHRYQEGGDPGIEPFLGDPMNERTADELQHQLEDDKYAKGPEFLRNTNLGKGTGKLFIFFNGQKMTPAQFIDQVQEDASEGFCHTINTYEYNNRVLASTKITITTKTGECKKSTPVKDKVPVKDQKPAKYCKHTKKFKLEGSAENTTNLIKNFQTYCKRKGLYFAEYSDGTTSKCNEIDGVIGCCTATCYAKTKRSDM
jgi:hypothetical protein